MGCCPAASTVSKVVHPSRPGSSASSSIAHGPPGPESPGTFHWTTKDRPWSGHYSDDHGAWAHPIEPWEQSDDRLVAAGWSKVLVAALEQLPRRQREVVILRDVERAPEHAGV